MRQISQNDVVFGLLMVLIASAATQVVVAAEVDTSRPVKVFILAGQSNMEGKAKISLLEHQINQPETKPLFQHLRKEGKWILRKDVWIKYLDRKGNLTVGFGSRGCIGPELEFGNTIGDYYDQQVLIIKTAWGGKSLYRDFRPPSSGLPPAEVLNAMVQQLKKRNPRVTMEEVKERFGFYYRAMVTEVRETLADLKSHFPAYQGQGYELAGLVWFQGWNDMINSDYTAEYSQNMANLIRDVRKDLKSPKLPVVIGVLGVGGDRDNPKRKAFQDAQAAPASLEEFRGNVAIVQTKKFWDETAQAVFDKGWKKHLDEWNTVGSDWPFHYLGSAKTFCAIGKAFGEAILELKKNQ